MKSIVILQKFDKVSLKPSSCKAYNMPLGSKVHILAIVPLGKNGWRFAAEEDKPPYRQLAFMCIEDIDKRQPLKQMINGKLTSISLKNKIVLPCVPSVKDS